MNCPVDDLLAVAIGPEQAARPEQAQVVADERAGDANPEGDLAYRPGSCRQASRIHSREG